MRSPGKWYYRISYSTSSFLDLATLNRAWHNTIIYAIEMLHRHRCSVTVPSFPILFIWLCYKIYLERNFYGDRKLIKSYYTLICHHKYFLVSEGNFDHGSHTLLLVTVRDFPFFAICIPPLCHLPLYHLYPELFLNFIAAISHMLSCFCWRSDLVSI